MVLRMADADVMPYHFNELALTVKGYTDNLKTEVKTLTTEANTRNKALSSGAYKLANDPKLPLLPPTTLPVPPTFDFTPLDAAIAKLDAAATRYDATLASTPSLTPAKRIALNNDLTVAERKLLGADGLPGRPWVKHLLYAPGTYTGYGASTLPGVREAIEDGRYDEAKQQLLVLSSALTDEAAWLDKLTAETAGN